MLLGGSALPPGLPRQAWKGALAANADNYVWVPDNSVDLILTDPPFNIAQDTNFHTWDKNTINSYRFDKGKDWDTYTSDEFLELLSAWSHEFYRVLRPRGTFAVFCADQYVSYFRSALEEAGFSVRRTLTWRKPNAVPINRKVMMMSACEYVIIGVKGNKATFNADLSSNFPDDYIDIERVLVGDKTSVIDERVARDAVDTVQVIGSARPHAIADAVIAARHASDAELHAKIVEMYSENEDGTYLRGCVPNEVRFSSKGGKRIHPTEKPVPLLRYLASLLSNEGELILDPFAGSGSTAEAALSLKRKAVLVERDREFYDALTTRIATYVEARQNETSALF